MSSATESKQNTNLLKMFQDAANKESNNNNDENIQEQISNTPEPPHKKPKSDPKLQTFKEAFGILKSATEKPPPQVDADNPELRSFCEFIFQKLKNYSKQSVNLIQQEILQFYFALMELHFPNKLPRDIPYVVIHRTRFKGRTPRRRLSNENPHALNDRVTLSQLQ